MSAQFHCGKECLYFVSQYKYGYNQINALKEYSTSVTAVNAFEDWNKQYALVNDKMEICEIFPNKQEGGG